LATRLHRRRVRRRHRDGFGTLAGAQREQPSRDHTPSCLAHQVFRSAEGEHWRAVTYTEYEGRAEIDRREASKRLRAQLV
jgi:hypothetical protein